MTHDRRIHADAVRRQLRGNHARRFKRQAGVMLGAMALGSVAAPYTMLDRDAQWAAGVYAYVRTSMWVADGAVADPEISVTYRGADYRVSARAVVASRHYREAVGAVLVYAGRGCGLGFAAWLFGLVLLRGAAARRRERALDDRVIAGTLVTTEKKLAKLVARDAHADALSIGSVPIPAPLETRHMAMIGTTGSGKTTALRQLLDCIEGRGDAALVYDTSGEFVAHYYRPERGDVILNPFDARCAFWTPFAEIGHPADAARIAHQFITETNSQDHDVWLETARILVANMIRKLWEEGNPTLTALLGALQVKTKDELKVWLTDTSSARTFADDADRATGSVLFMLAKAADLVQFLRAEDSGGAPFAFRDFMSGLTRDYADKGVARGEAYSVESIDPAKAAITLKSEDGRAVDWRLRQWGAGKTQAFAPQSLELKAGDAIRFTRNDREMGRVNGGRGIVISVDEKSRTATIQTSKGRTETLNLDAARDRHIAHAYVETTFAAQGRTADHVIIHADSRATNLVDQKSFYVGISRAKASATVFTNDRGKLVSAISERAGQVQTAIAQAVMASPVSVKAKVAGLG